MITNEDLRQRHLLDRIPTIAPPRQPARPLHVRYWLFHTLEVVTCLVGFGIVGLVFLGIFLVLLLSGLWWLALLYAWLGLGSFAQYQNERKRG